MHCLETPGLGFRVWPRFMTPSRSKVFRLNPPHAPTCERRHGGKWVPVKTSINQIMPLQTLVVTLRYCTSLKIPLPRLTRRGCEPTEGAAESGPGHRLWLSFGGFRPETLPLPLPRPLHLSISPSLSLSLSLSVWCCSLSPYFCLA